LGAEMLANGGEGSPNPVGKRPRITARHAGFHLHHADLANTLYRDKGRRADRYVFSFPDETFDVEFATSVFTHLVPASAHQYAREIARLPKPKSG
jgi:Methyltransferase domain